MKWQFLCSNHQAWLEQNPHVAKTTALQCSDRAESLAEEGEQLLAIKFAGSGYEAAQIVLQYDSSPIGERVDILTASAMLLVNLMHEAGQQSIARSVITSTVGQLESLLSLGYGRREVLMGCQSLLTLGDNTSESGSAFAHGFRQVHRASPSQLH